MEESIETQLLKRAEIRRQIPTRKSVQEGKPDRIADLLETAAAEISRLKDKCDKQAMILRRINPDKHPDTYFICGESRDEKDVNGLPTGVFICPAYGCDWSVYYEKTERGIHPEW